MVLTNKFLKVCNFILVFMLLLNTGLGQYGFVVNAKSVSDTEAALTGPTQEYLQGDSGSDQQELEESFTLVGVDEEAETAETDTSDTDSAEDLPSSGEEIVEQFTLTVESGSTATDPDLSQEELDEPATREVGSQDPPADTQEETTETDTDQSGEEQPQEDSVENTTEEELPSEDGQSDQNDDTVEETDVSSNDADSTDSDSSDNEAPISDSEIEDTTDEETTSSDSSDEYVDPTVMQPGETIEYDKNLKYMDRSQTVAYPTDNEDEAIETTAEEETAEPADSISTENEENQQSPAQLTGTSSDPAVSVYCDWLPEYTCGQSVTCSADVSNTANAPDTTEGLIAQIEATNATITSIDSDGGLDCSLSQGEITCDGVELDPNELETVIFWVTFDNCPCGEYTADVDGSVSVTHTDVDTTNNADDHVLTVQGPTCTQCTDPITTFTLDSHNYGDVVTDSPVTLYGTIEGGVDEVVVMINGNVYSATINGNTWSATVPLQSGQNNFWLKAIPSDPECDIEEIDFSLTYEPSTICVDPITTFTLDSHTNNEVVTDSPITVTGTVDGGVQAVVVSVNGNDYYANINGNTWSATIPLQPGTNGIYVEAQPTDADCDIESATVVVEYQTAICVDPITNLTIDSHTNNEVVTNSPVDLQGTVEGGVDNVVVVVNGTNYQATINGNTWSITVPLQQGDNDIWVVAHPSDADCDIVEEGINLKYQPDICVDPITNLTIDSHTNNEVVTNSPVDLQGTVEGGVDNVVVVVNGTNYQAVINGNTWSVTVPLQQGDNDIWVLAYPTDADCDIVEEGINLKYQPGNICVDPITDLTIDSHTNNEVVTNSPVDLEGTVEGGVDQVVVVVNGTNYQAVINGNTWSVTVPLQQGDNDIWVLAYPTDADCDIVEEGINLKYQPDNNICVDPITNLTIESHDNHEIVTNSPVTLTGIVEGGVDQVMVELANGDIYQATINGTTWEVTVPMLQQGRNIFWVKAIPSDDDCDNVVIDFGLKYQPDDNICVDPITNLTIESHADNEVVTDSPVDLEGIVQGGVDQVVVVVNGINYQATINGTTWSVTVPLQQGDNDIWVLAYPSDDDCNIVEEGINLKYQPDDNICVDPVTQLTITSPVDGAEVTDTTIAVEGTVEGGVDRVEVNGVVANLVGNEWVALVDLDEGENDIRVVAFPSDEECSPVTRTIQVTQSPEICVDPIELTIDRPEDGTSTRNSSITVAGNVDDPTVDVYVDGDLVDVDSDGDFETTVSLSVGSNSITVTAGEGVCETTEQVTVTRRGGGGGGNIGGDNYCGDGIARHGEQCDDGNNRNGDGCSANCKLEDPVCGNGVIEFNEQCDDGNRRDGDGCNAFCELEDDVIDEIRKKKIKDRISKKPTPDLVPLQLPAVLPKTGDIERPMKQERVPSPSW